MMTWLKPVPLGMKGSLLRSSYGAYTRGTLKAKFPNPATSSWHPINVQRIIEKLPTIGVT